MTTAPITNTPNFEHPFILEVDACEYGLGAVLSQEYDNHKYVIAYASPTLSAAERKYGATEREALAIVWATKHFRAYIEGSKVLIRSDCKALKWLRNAKDITGRLARWAMILSTYQIESINYRPAQQKMRKSQFNIKKKETQLRAKNEQWNAREKRERIWVLRYSDRNRFLRKGLSFTCPTCNLISVSERCPIRCYFEQGH